MIFRLNYEETQALRAGARAYLEREQGSAPAAVLAAPERRSSVETLLPRLQGDLSLSTLEDLRNVQGSVSAIVELLRVEMESSVRATHPADEVAVAAYFDFAHALTVARRLREMAAEMEAMIEIVTGEAPSREMARTFVFPD